jgi:DNA-binding transcriptional ArsR family regulator
MYGERESHPIYVWNGILEPKHREGIGPALWEFLWCLDRITKEKDGIGIVLGGKPVTYAEIAEDFGIPGRTVRRHMGRLEDKEYLILIRTPRGFSIRVPRSCKFAKLTKTATQTGQKWPLTVTKAATHCDKNGHSNKSKQLSKQLEEAVEETAAANSAPRPFSPFPVLNELGKDKTMPGPKTEKELDQRRRDLLRQAEQLMGVAHAH